jgi:hypothetical protein
MNVLEPVKRIVRTIWDGYERNRNRRILEELPPYIRKDIGWPDPRGRIHRH